MGDDVQNDLFPDLGRGHPGQASAPPNEAMLRRIAGPATTSPNNWVDRVGPEACADQILIELTELSRVKLIPPPMFKEFPIAGDGEQLVGWGIAKQAESGSCGGDQCRVG